MPRKRGIRALLALRNAVACSAVEAYLRARQGCTAVLAPGGPLATDALLALIVSERIDLLLLELEPDSNLLEGVRRSRPALPVVVVVAAHPELAFRAAKAGATEILVLPVTDEDLVAKLDPAIESIISSSHGSLIPGPRGSTSEVVSPSPEPFVEAAADDFPNSFGASRRMAEIRDTIEKVATTSATVLIRGESGVGKEIVARMIFARSERSHKAFVKVNCAAIPNELLESELFGFEAGAFTGAQRAKPGKFEMADGGTMFLDEIGEMHPMLQAKLLHVLQDGEFARLGSKHDTSVDVRVICATNQLLEQRVAEGLFREDLFYRINVVTIPIPPLRERRDEIPLLLDYFVRKYSSVYRRSVAPLDPELTQFLLSYSWPGNIRELENLCKRYVIMGGAAQIIQELTGRSEERSGRIEAAFQEVPSVEVAAPQASLLEIGRQAAWMAEREAIRKALAETHWNRKEAARRLQVSYKALLNKIGQMSTEDLGQKRHGDAS